MFSVFLFLFLLISSHLLSWHLLFIMSFFCLLCLCWWVLSSCFTLVYPSCSLSMVILLEILSIYPIFILHPIGMALLLLAIDFSILYLPWFLYLVFLLLPRLIPHLLFNSLFIFYAHTYLYLDFCTYFSILILYLFAFYFYSSHFLTLLFLWCVFLLMSWFHCFILFQF